MPRDARFAQDLDEVIRLDFSDGHRVCPACLAHLSMGRLALNHLLFGAASFAGSARGPLLSSIIDAVTGGHKPELVVGADAA